MIQPGTETDWFCNYGLDLNIDFCFWILEVDGLHVPPFSRHDDGDGTLQARGMNAVNWHSWMQTVVQQHDKQKYLSQRDSVRLTNETWRSFNADPTAPKGDDRERMLAFQKKLMQAEKEHNVHMPEFTSPPQYWESEDTVKEHLNELWEEYRTVSHVRRSWEREMALQWQKAASNGPVPDLWHELEPYHKRIPSLFIHFVPYPVEITYPISPISVVMTVVDGKLDRDAFGKRALQAAAALTQKDQTPA